MSTNVSVVKPQARYWGFDDCTDEGVHFTSEAWRRTLDPDRRLLAFAGLHSVFLQDQAVSYLCGGTLDSVERAREANELLNRRTGQQQWFCAVRYPLWRGLTGPLEVFYLTQHGVVELRKLAPILARFSCPGKPTGVNYERIPHDVGIVYAHLRAIKSVEVWEFLNEKWLKSMIAHARIERGGEPSVSEATGDFELLYKRKEAGRTHRIQCEVATSEMKPEQIRRKPDGMRWFTFSLHKRDVIAEIKGSGTQIDLLPDPVERHIRLARLLLGHVPAKALNGPGTQPMAGGVGQRTELRPREKRILHALERLGGAATTEAVAALLGVNRSGVSACLNGLERRKIVRSEGACLCAVHDLGTPTLLYMPAQISLPDENERRHRLLISTVLVNNSRKGFLFASLEKGVLEMRQAGDPDQPPLLVVADHHGLDLLLIRQRIRVAQGRNSGGRPVVVVMTEGSRMRALSEQNLGVTILDGSRKSRAKAV